MANTSVQIAYNEWSRIYDEMSNETRDMEANAIRSMISGKRLSILELGCGTGKNTQFLKDLADEMIAVDFFPRNVGKGKGKSLC
jgi:ubiquinone/menaquinone biosynthesis C-methylase UbiE